jgi:hypothetical protein
MKNAERRMKNGEGAKYVWAEERLPEREVYGNEKEGRDAHLYCLCKCAAHTVTSFFRFFAYPAHKLLGICLGKPFAIVKCADKRGKRAAVDLFYICLKLFCLHKMRAYKKIKI